MDKYQSWKAKVFHFGTEQLCQRAIHEWLRWDLWKILTFWQNSDCFRTPLQQKVRIRTQKENSDQSGSSAYDNNTILRIFCFILGKIHCWLQEIITVTSSAKIFLCWLASSWHLVAECGTLHSLWKLWYGSSVFNSHIFFLYQTS